MTEHDNLELAVLGGLFLDTENRYIEGIPDYCFHDTHTKRTFAFLRDNPHIRDITSAAAEVAKERLNKDIVKLLIEAMNATSGLAMLPTHIKQLKRKRSVEHIHKIVASAEGTLTDEQLENIHELSAPQVDEETKVQSFEELSLSFEKRYNIRRKLYKDGFPYITGLPSLDDFLGGLHKKETLVIGGRTSLGKTALMTSIGMANAKKGCRVLMFQCEMDPEHIADRMISSESGLENFKIRYGKLKPEDFPTLKSALEKDNFFRIPFYICYSPKLTISKIKAVVTQYKPDIAIIDHIQMMRFKSNNRAQEMEEVAYAIHHIGVDKNIAMVVGSQINRSSTNPALAKTLDPSGFKGSGGIEESAETCLEIKVQTGKSKEDKIWNLTLEISKQRHGPVGSIPVKFYRHNLTFSEN